MSSREPDFSSSLDSGFWYWITERHDIYLRRKTLTKPWTKDRILQQYKFTNAFRQLDKGTIALRKMVEKYPSADSSSILFNVWWYRLFNWHEHAELCGFVTDFAELVSYMTMRHETGKRVFTNAHMTTGVSCEDKYVSYLRAAREAFDNAENVHKVWRNSSMEDTFARLRRYYMVGPFVAYEIVCAMRFLVPPAPIDVDDWANLGPGARRGLIRLGLLSPSRTGKQAQELGLAAMKDLLAEAKETLPERVLEAEVPFELREIEHSLCEFDKYERVRRGEGKPRLKYDGGNGL